MTIAGGLLFFSASDLTSNGELFVTDGTLNGTKMVKDLNPGPQGSSPAPATVLNNKLIFGANISGEGYEMWTSDGSTGGTYRLKDIYPGPKDGFWISTKGRRNFGGKFYFCGRTPTSGNELWVTDGTPTGTHKTEEIGIYPDSSTSGDVQWIYVVDSTTIYIAANDGQSGNELFMYKAPKDTSNSVSEAAQPSRQISVYPNPAKESFTVQLDNNDFLNGVLYVYDITGRAVYSQTITRTQRKIYVPLRNATVDIYQVVVQLDEDVITQSLQVE